MESKLDIISPETLLLLCGIHSLGFALFHMGFWKLFDWRTQLPKLNFANRGIMQILNIQLTYYLLFLAVSCFMFPSALLNTELGSFFLLANAGFWALRTVAQFIFLRANHYFIHILTVLFVLGSLLFAMAALIH